MMPTPPSWAIAIASRPSVTVSMAADSRGIFREILRVTCVFRLVSRGRTLENAGTRSTSSNVSAFWIRRMANPMGAKPNYTDSSPDFHCPNSSLRGVPHFLPQFTASDGWAIYLAVSLFRSIYVRYKFGFADARRIPADAGKDLGNQEDRPYRASLRVHRRPSMDPPRRVFSTRLCRASFGSTFSGR